MLSTDVDEQGTRLVYPPEGTSTGFEYIEFDPVRGGTDRAIAAQSQDSNQGPEYSYLKPSVELVNGDCKSCADQPPLWSEPQDSTMAINNPDLYAWRLFVALNWPADLENRKADSSREFGENATTVWESWKFSSGANDEVFLSNGADPGPWLNPAQDGDAFKRKAKDFELLPLQQRMFMNDAHQEFDRSTSAVGLNENHVNKDAFEFIRDQELYNIEGQEAHYAAAKAIFDQASAEDRPVAAHEYKMHFPVGAKEVKAQWRTIPIEDKGKYYWVEFEDADGSKVLYGLTALHITTKDIPNWLWATFEHVDNPNREDARPWETPTVDSAAGEDGFPEGLGIEGTRWENYRLRGTQVDFVDSFGNATILANSQIESSFQSTSSCITCHARAAIGARIGTQERANRLSIFKTVTRPPGGPTVLIGSVGTVPEELFIRKTFSSPIAGELDYLQLDFVWSMMRAQRKSSDSNEPEQVRFSQHILPLFRQKDIDSMKTVFDLGSHTDVSTHADAIFKRLKDGSMPCDVPWSANNVQLFKRWIDGGKKE